MIPCRISCPNYFEGCHKQCSQWVHYRSQLQLQHKAKMDYLRQHTEASQDVVARCRAITLSRCHF